MLAHHAVQVRKALEIKDLLRWAFAAHASVPLVVALDEADDTTTAVAVDGLLVIGRIVRDELGLLARANHRLAGTHHHVCCTLGDLEGRVDFSSIVVGADVVESGLSLGLEAGSSRLRKARGWDRNLKEFEDRREGSDCVDVEVRPTAQVTDVPPEMVVDSAANASNAADQCR